MRRTGKEKLHSQRGASLLFAFLFLLVAAMVSAVVIAGAVTAVKRVHDDHVREQSYLTLESASRLLRQMLKETTLSVTVSVTSSGGAIQPPVYSYEGGGPLGKIVREAVETLNGGDTAVKRYFMVTVPQTPHVPESQAFRDVRMEFTMKKDSENSNMYRVDGTLQVKDGISSDDYEQRLFLSTSFAPEGAIMPEPEQEKTTPMPWAEVKLYTRKSRGEIP